MKNVSTEPHGIRVLPRRSFDDLLHAIRKRGFELIGPCIRDGAIVYDPIFGTTSLPEGWRAEQSAGRSRLQPRGDKALFGYGVSSESWRKFLHPARRSLWQAQRQPQGLRFHKTAPEPRPLALVGIRACEIAALAVLDQVMATPSVHSATASTRTRAECFIVAVQCTEPGGTCFCSSMGTGPRVREGYDLCLTELLAEGQHEFLVEVGSARGREVLEEVDSAPVEPDVARQARTLVEGAARRMGRRMDASGVRDLLRRSSESKYWSEVAGRCLACANCTMVCPTCFCTRVEENSDLKGERAERTCIWDSCFNVAFSYIHGGSVRTSLASRYRQWLTHKLAFWHDQFGRSGCVGCGRCITWCPAGIDITEEVAALQRAEEHQGRPRAVEAR